jgi:hypothetical protein
MPKFTVYEVQEYIVWEKFEHEVEAASAEDAKRIVREGNSDPESCGEYGEGDYGKSGLHAVRKDRPHDLGEAWSFAALATPA